MINARIVDVVPLEDQIELKKCQIEIALEDSCKLIVQFGDLKCWMEEDTTDLELKLVTKCKSCQELNKMEKIFKTDEDYVFFLKKYNRIKDSKCDNEWITASKADLITTVSSLISCVGCRTSLERFHRSQANKLIKKAKSFSNVIYPFLIKPNDSISLCSNVLDDPFKLFSIFSLKNSKIEIKTINRSCSTNFSSISKESNCLQSDSFNSICHFQKLNCLNSNICNIVQPNLSLNKNRRCQLHSLDKSRFKSMNDWIIVWDAFIKNNTRSKILTIDTSKLMDTVDSYLKRHRFCSDCKIKVIKAFNILTGQMDGCSEKNFCSSIYEGIECCSMTNDPKASKKAKFHLDTQHLHLKNDKNFIAALIYKAETEIQGGRRERHAKTLDIAQEEVLTCIGIYLFEKFFLIFQSIRLDEQIWQLMIYSTIVALKKNFELTYEQLQGISNLELVCAQFEAQESKKKAKHRGKNRKNRDNKIDGNQLTKLDVDDQEYESENSLGSSLISKAYEKDELEKSCNTSCQCLNDIKLNFFNSMSSSSSTSSSSTDDFKDFSFTSFVNEFDMAKNHDEDLVLITDEEKNEYYANKSVYLNERTNRRLLLRERFQNLKLNASFKLRPRN